MLSVAEFFERPDIAGLVPASNQQQRWTEEFEEGTEYPADNREILIIL
jgi:hypothetical protein